MPKCMMMCITYIIRWIRDDWRKSGDLGFTYLQGSFYGKTVTSLQSRFKNQVLGRAPSGLVDMKTVKIYGIMNNTQDVIPLPYAQSLLVWYRS
jgi:hypothetical protein